MKKKENVDQLPSSVQWVDKFISRKHNARGILTCYTAWDETQACKLGDYDTYYDAVIMCLAYALELQKEGVALQNAIENDPLQDEVHTYNKYSSSKMELKRTAEEYFDLYIAGTLITSDDYNNMLERVQGINRENGYTYL